MSINQHGKALGVPPGAPDRGDATLKVGRWGRTSRTARHCAILTAALAWGSLVAVPANAAAPNNDEISAAVTVTGLPYTDTVDTTEATSAEGDYSLWNGRTVWYTFTPDTAGTYAFDTLGSNYDTTLAVLQGTPGDLSLVAENDDTGLPTNGALSALLADLAADTTYYIEAANCCSAPGGDLVIHVNVAPPPFDVEATIDSVKLGAEPGTLVVAGTLTCNSEALGILGGEVKREQGRNLPGLYFDAHVECSPNATGWSATTPAISRNFLPMHAAVSLSAMGGDAFTWDTDSVTRSIKVTRR